MHTTLDISKEHKRNLVTLARYLYDLKPDENMKFDMYDFAHKSTPEDDWAIGPFALVSKQHEDCKTSACAVGHAVFLFPPLEDNWVEYTERVFGISGTRDGRLRDAFAFMFGGFWNKIDNSPRGAAQRIIFALTDGVPHSDDFCTDEQLRYWEDQYVRLTLDNIPSEEDL